MNTFPTLTASPDIASHVEDYSSEAVEVASFASGYPCLNELFSFDPMTWQQTLSNVSQTDKDTLMNFYQVNKGLPFYWENEQNDTVYEVFFVQQPSRQIQNDDDKAKWKISVMVRQITPTELPPSTPSSESYTTQFYGGPAMVDIEDLAPGVSISARPVFALGMSLTMTGAHILTKGTPAGIDNSNTVVITLKKNDDTTVFTKTYNTATQPPTSGLGSLGSPLTDTLAADEWLELYVTQTGTANMPAFSVVLEGTFSQSATPVASTVEIEDLAPGISIADRPLMAFGQSITITGIHILTKGTPEGVDNSNTVVIAVKKNDGTTVVTKTYNTGTQPPTNGRADLGTILSAVLAVTEWLEISVTQTGTADMPIFSVILDGYYNN